MLHCTGIPGRVWGIAYSQYATHVRAACPSHPQKGLSQLRDAYIYEGRLLTNLHTPQSATCRVRNAFGGAETFEANVAFATKTRMSFNASLSKPLSSDLKTRGEVALFGLERDNSSFASSSEGLRGFRAVVRVS